jgi:hypothetical protein
MASIHKFPAAVETYLSLLGPLIKPICANYRAAHEIGGNKTSLAAAASCPPAEKPAIRPEGSSRTCNHWMCDSSNARGIYRPYLHKPEYFVEMMPVSAAIQA